jgi:hypothetical protein
MHILKEYSGGERSAFELGVVVGAAAVVGFIYITDINIFWSHTFPLLALWCSRISDFRSLQNLFVMAYKRTCDAEPLYCEATLYLGTF